MVCHQIIKGIFEIKVVVVEISWDSEESHEIEGVHCKRFHKLMKDYTDEISDTQTLVYNQFASLVFI